MRGLKNLLLFPLLLSISPASAQYQGPGYYRIQSSEDPPRSPLNVHANGPTRVGSLVDLQTPLAPPNDSPQIWLIQDAGRGLVRISNIGNRLFLSATKKKETVLAYTVADDPRQLWAIDVSLWAGTPLSPVVFFNKGFPSYVLDDYNGSVENPTPLVVYPLNQPPTFNQAWLLERV